MSNPVLSNKHCKLTIKEVLSFYRSLNIPSLPVDKRFYICQEKETYSQIEPRNIEFKNKNSTNVDTLIIYSRAFMKEMIIHDVPKSSYTLSINGSNVGNGKIHKILENGNFDYIFNVSQMNSDAFQINKQICNISDELSNESTNDYINLGRVYRLCLHWTKKKSSVSYAVFDKEHIDITISGYIYNENIDSIREYNETKPYYFNYIQLDGFVTDNIYIQYKVIDKSVEPVITLRINGCDYNSNETHIIKEMIDTNIKCKYVNPDIECDYMVNDSQYKVIKLDTQFFNECNFPFKLKLHQSVVNENFSEYINQHTIFISNLDEIALCCENVEVEKITVNHFVTYYSSIISKKFSLN